MASDTSIKVTRRRGSSPAPVNPIAGSRVKDRILLVGMASLGLAGCATHYTAAQGSPTATVIFATSAPRTDGVMVQTFADRKCKHSETGTRVAYFYKDLFDDRAGTAKPVTAGREFVFSFWSRSDTGTVATFCTVTRAFVPEASATYRAHYESSPGQCNVKVSKVDPAGAAQATPVEPDIVDPVCFDEFRG